MGSAPAAAAAVAAQPAAENQPAAKRQRVQPAGLQTAPAASHAATAPKQPKWSMFLDEDEEAGSAPMAAQQQQGWQAYADVQQQPEQQQQQQQQRRAAAEPVQPQGSWGRPGWGQADAGADDLELSPSSSAGTAGGYRPIVRPPQAAAMAPQPSGWGPQRGAVPQRAGHIQQHNVAAGQQPSRAPSQPPLQQPPPQPPGPRPVQAWQQPQQAQQQAQQHLQRAPLQPSRQQPQQPSAQPKQQGQQAGDGSWKPPPRAATTAGPLHASDNGGGLARPMAAAGRAGGSRCSWNSLVDGVVQLGWPTAEEAARPARRVAVPDAFGGGGQQYVQTWCNALLEELNLRWVGTALRTSNVNSCLTVWSRSGRCTCSKGCLNTRLQGLGWH